MNTGQIISGAGHIGLIFWILFGGLFSPEPMIVETTDVSMITGEEYAALMAQEQAPDAVAMVETPEPPKIDATNPDLSSVADAAPDLSQPDTAQETPPDTAPDVSQMTPPDVADVSDDTPELLPPNEEVAVMVPEVSPRPQERPSTRVAPIPVAPSEPDVRIDDVARPEVAPDAAAETPREQTEATAQKEASTKIVTEAEKAAPSRSLRPQARPTRRPEPAEEPQDTQTAQQPPDSSVKDALAEALAASNAEPSAPSGPPMTRGEKDALRLAVQQCWNVGALSSEALRTTVVVAVSMTKDGKPVTGSIKQLSATGGSGAAAQQAYEAARRAIIRCGATGYNLPRDKYDRWRHIEITFNPEKMRIK
jgi:hypothetical protein